eukprot:2511693-Rhodomonas_salina.4
MCGPDIVHGARIGCTDQRAYGTGLSAYARAMRCPVLRSYYRCQCCAISVTNAGTMPRVVPSCTNPRATTSDIPTPGHVTICSTGCVPCLVLTWRDLLPGVDMAAAEV